MRLTLKPNSEYSLKIFFRNFELTAYQKDFKILSAPKFKFPELSLITAIFDVHLRPNYQYFKN